MPNGERKPPYQPFREGTITAVEYLYRLNAYLNSMIQGGAMTREGAADIYDSALGQAPSLRYSFVSTDVPFYKQIVAGEFFRWPEEIFEPPAPPTPTPPEPSWAKPMPFTQAMRGARVEAGALPSPEAVSYPFLEQLEPGVREYAETQLPAIYGRFVALGGEEARETWWTARQQEEQRQRATGIQRGTVRGRRLEMKAVLPKAAISPSFAAYYKELGEREKKLTAKVRGRRRATLPAGEDPFLKYLKAYPFTAEWQKARPQEAFPAAIPPTPEPEPTPFFGYGQYAPPARWLLF